MEYVPEWNAIGQGVAISLPLLLFTLFVDDKRLAWARAALLIGLGLMCFGVAFEAVAWFGLGAIVCLIGNAAVMVLAGYELLQRSIEKKGPSGGASEKKNGE